MFKFNRDQVFTVAVVVVVLMLAKTMLTEQVVEGGKVKTKLKGSSSTSSSESEAVVVKNTDSEE